MSGSGFGCGFDNDDAGGGVKIFQASFVVLHIAAALIHAFLWQDRMLRADVVETISRGVTHAFSALLPADMDDRADATVHLYLGGGRQTSVFASRP